MLLNKNYDKFSHHRRREVCDFLFLGVHYVAVGVECQPDVAVTEDGLQGFDVCAAMHDMGCEGVAQVVQPDFFFSAAVEGGAEISGMIEFAVVMDDEFFQLLAAFPVGAQFLGKIFGNYYFPVRCFGFGIGKNYAGFADGCGVADSDFVFVEENIFPGQSECFRSADAG